jgi:protein TonB
LSAAFSLSESALRKTAAVSVELSTSALEDTMFAASLLESNWANRSHRGWTTLASFTMQTLAVGMLLALPLIYSEGVPKLRVTTIGAPIGPPPGRPAEGVRHAANSPHPAVRPFQIGAPTQIPTTTARDSDEIPIPSVQDCTGCVPGGTGQPGFNNPIFNSIGNSVPVAPPPPPKPAATQPRISRMMEGNLIYKPQPAYPPIAHAGRVQGAVVLRAIIRKTGTIENLQVISGHPLLIKAAVDAVSQWRYRPYVLNGEPVEVETQVIVNFTLSGG